MQATYYVAAGFEWSAGDTVSNQMFWNAPRKTFFLPAIPVEYVSNPDFCARRNTEIKLEAVRTRSFNDLPSRRDAIFLNKNEEDARKWLQRGSRSAYHIYELNPIRTDAAFETNYIWYNYLVRLHKDALNETRKLFSGDVATEIGHCLTAYWTNRATEEFRSPSKPRCCLREN
jgi:hypothetical protein